MTRRSRSSSTGSCEASARVSGGRSSPEDQPTTPWWLAWFGNINGIDEFLIEASAPKFCGKMNSEAS